MTLRVESSGVDYLKAACLGHCKPFEVSENGRVFYPTMTRTGLHNHDWDLYRDVSLECQKGLNGLKIWNYEDFSFEQIGEGFYGTVYKVVHQYTKEVLVLKELKNAADDEHKQMFIEEIKLLNKLCHPNLLKFKGLAVHDQRLCFLAEYIEGGCLEDMIAIRDLQLSSWTTRVNIALDVARAMAYLHAEGVMHRDLAAKNILIRKLPNGKLQAIVADLGLSYRIPNQLISEDYDLDTVGSPFHMAPEVIHCKPYSIKADIFSYGIILCEIISGCPGADPDDVPRTQEFGLAIEEFSELVSDCPTELLDLTVRCCQVVPSDRPSFVDIVKVLDIILDKLQEKGDNRSLSLLHVQSRNRLLSMDYMIEPSLVCACGKENQFLDDSFLGIKITEDRLGTMQRTASRQMLRMLAARCDDCGGRVLGANSDAQTTVLPVLDGLQQNQVDDLEPGLEMRKVDHIQGTVKMPGETDGTVRAYQFTAGSLLHQDSEAIVAGTTHLAENTPGRLPKFFRYLLRTKRSRLRPRDGGSGKRRFRKSLTDLFASSSTSGSYSQGLRGDHDSCRNGTTSCLTSPRDEKDGEAESRLSSFPSHLVSPRGKESERNFANLDAEQKSRAEKGWSPAINSVQELSALHLDSPISRRHSMPPNRMHPKANLSNENCSSAFEKSQTAGDDFGGEIPLKKKRSRSIFSLFRRKKSET